MTRPLFTFEEFTTRESKIVILGLLATLLLYYLGPTAAIFWTAFFTFILFSISSKYVAQITLICLITLPILMAIGYAAMAEQMAVYVFFLLTMTVGLQIFELKFRPAKEVNSEIKSAPVQSQTQQRYVRPAVQPIVRRPIPKAPKIIIDIIRVKRPVKRDVVITKLQPSFN